MQRLLFSIFIASSLFSCQQKNYTTGSAPRDIMIPNELEVTKLMLGGKELTSELGAVRITDKQWSEYDRDGNVIGVAEIQNVTNHTFSIKWTMAENGAHVGDKTRYEYHVLSDKVLFTIWFDKAQRGYFEAQLKTRP